MNIAVVFTGGTIGSKADGGVIAPGMPNRKLLSVCPKDVKADIYEPYTSLSEYLTGEHINKLVLQIKELLKKNYDGIIITHGTDTMQYSAAALGFIFAGAEIPIMLVGAQYVLDDERTNGYINFTDSVEFIRQNLGKGVFVCYRNDSGKRKVHLGTRLIAAAPYSNDFESVKNLFFGEFKDSGFVKNPNFKAEGNRADIFKDAKLQKYCRKILCLEARAGLYCGDIPAGIAAVLHSSFHCGTLNTHESTVFKKAKEKNIPVFLTGSGSTAYESASAFETLGITVLPEMSPLAAYVKLWLITDNNLPFDLIRENICGELI